MKKTIKILNNRKKLLYRFKQLRFKAFVKRYFFLKKLLLQILEFERNFKNQLKIKLLQLIYILKKQLIQQLYIMVLLVVFLLLLPNIAFAEGGSNSNELQLAGALTVAGVVTVITFIFGTRYILLGDDVSHMTKSTLTTVNKMFDRLDQLMVKYIGESKPSKIAGTSQNIQNEITQGQIELTADRILDKLGHCMDERVNKLNPLSYAEGAKNKMVVFIRKVLNNANIKSNNLANLEQNIDSLGEEAKVKLQTGLQKFMQDLEKKGEDLEKALDNMNTHEIEELADYVSVSISRPNSAAGDSEGTGELVSVVEPLLSINVENLCSFIYLIVIQIIILQLFSPLNLYFWIKIKRFFY